MALCLKSQPYIVQTYNNKHVLLYFIARKLSKLELKNIPASTEIVQTISSTTNKK